MLTSRRKAKPEDGEVPELIKEWTLTPAATLGSAVRAKGILLELRARLPSVLRKSLDIEAGMLRLTMPESSRSAFRSVSATIVKSLEDIENLPVIPREIQDILAISATERRRWLDDGRLPSVGTRTVRLKGRARQITFHVFDPRVVEDLLDRGAADEWREEDAIAKAENRRRAAYQVKLTRSLRKNGKSEKPLQKSDQVSRQDAGEAQTGLSGWDAFDSDGYLR